MPARKVATGLPPIMVTCRPNGVLAMMKVKSGEAGDREPGDQRDVSDGLDAHDPQRWRQILRRTPAGDRHHQAAHPDIGGERDDEGVHLELDHQPGRWSRR